MAANAALQTWRLFTTFRTRWHWLSPGAAWSGLRLTD